MRSLGFRISFGWLRIFGDGGNHEIEIFGDRVDPATLKRLPDIE
jgi:hypothetical protein